MRKKDIFFVVIETAIYISFIVHDLLSVQSSLIKYSGILFCFVYMLINRKKYGSIAMFLTCIADFFLLVTDDCYIAGVSFFIAVQLIYCLYLSEEDVKPHLILRTVLPLISFILLNNIGMANILNALTVGYFSQLLLSCIFSFGNRKLRLFSLGLSLFVCCDICVGLHNIYPYNGTVAMLQWIFYLPSQAIIAYAISK